MPVGYRPPLAVPEQGGNLSELSRDELIELLDELDELEKRANKEASAARRAEQAKESPIPEGVGRYVRPAIAFGANFLERLPESAAGLAEEVTNVAAGIANLYTFGDIPFAGKSIPELVTGKAEPFERQIKRAEGIRIPRLNIVPELERRNILIEPNVTERIFGGGGQIAAFMAPLGALGKFQSLQGVARAIRDGVGLASLTVLDNRRTERLFNIDITPQEYMTSALVAAASIPVGMVVGGLTNKALEIALRRPLSDGVKRFTTDAALGAFFEGAPSGWDPEKMASGIIGFTTGNVMGAYFGGRARPFGPEQRSRSIELSAQIVEQLGLLTGDRSRNLDPATDRATRVQYVWNTIVNLDNAIIGKSPEWTKADKEALAAAAGIETNVVEHLVLRSQMMGAAEREAIVTEKIAAAAVEIAANRGFVSWMETRYQNDMLTGAEKLRWEDARKGKIRQPSASPEEALATWQARARGEEVPPAPPAAPGTSVADQAVSLEEAFRILQREPGLRQLVEGEALARPQAPRVPQAPQEPGPKAEPPGAAERGMVPVRPGGVPATVGEPVRGKREPAWQEAARAREPDTAQIMASAIKKTYGDETRVEKTGTYYTVYRLVSEPGEVTAFRQPERPLAPVPKAPQEPRRRGLFGPGGLAPGQRVPRPGETTVTETGTGTWVPVNRKPSKRDPKVLLARAKEFYKGQQVQVTRGLEGYTVWRFVPKGRTIAIQPTVEELLAQTERKPGPKQLQRVIVPPPGAEQTAGMREAVWTPVGEPMGSPEAVSKRLALLKKKSPGSTFRPSPGNPLQIERQLRPRERVTVAEAEALAKQVNDREGDLLKTHIGEHDAQRALDRVRQQNPDKPFRLVEKLPGRFTIEQGAPVSAPGEPLEREPMPLPQAEAPRAEPKKPKRPPRAKPAPAVAPSAAGMIPQTPVPAAEAVYRAELTESLRGKKPGDAVLANVYRQTGENEWRPEMQLAVDVVGKKMKNGRIIADAVATQKAAIERFKTEYAAKPVAERRAIPEPEVPEPKPPRQMKPRKERQQKKAERTAQVISGKKKARTAGDAVEEYNAKTGDYPDGSNIYDVRKQLGDFEIGPYKGISKAYIIQKYWLQRDWRRYGKKGQSFNNFVNRLPAEFFGGDAARDAFLAEHRLGGQSAGMAPGPTPVEVAAAPPTKRVERMPADVLAVTPIEGMSQLPTSIIFRKPAPQPGARLQHALDEVLAAPTPPVMGAYERATPEQRAKIEETLDKMEVENRAERVEVERVISDADAEIMDKVARDETLKPASMNPFYENLPLLLLGAGIGAYALLRGKDPNADENEKSGVPMAAGFFLLPIFGRGRGRSRAGQRAVEARAARTQAADPVVVLGIKRLAEARRREKTIAQVNAEIETAWKSRNSRKMKREVFEKSINEINDAAKQLGFVGADEAMDTSFYRPRGDAFVQRFWKTVGHALATNYGEFGKEAVRIAQRIVSEAVRAYRLALHDVSSMSKMRWDTKLLKIRRPGQHRSDYDNLHDIITAVGKNFIFDIKTPVPLPNTPKVELYVTAAALRQLGPRGMTQRRLEQIWGRPISDKAMSELNKFMRTADDYLSAAKEGAIKMLPGFEPWQGSPYWPMLMIDRARGPEANRWEQMKAKLGPKDLEAQAAEAAELQNLMAMDVAKNMQIPFADALKAVRAHGEDRTTSIYRRDLNDNLVKTQANIDLHKLLNTWFGTEYDWGAVMEQYFKPVYTRLAFARHAGPNGERLIALKDVAIQSGYDGHSFVRLIDLATLQSHKLLETTRMPIIDEIAAASAFSLLGSAGVSQVSAWFRIPLEIEFKHFLKAFPTAVKGFLYQSAGVPEFVRKRWASEDAARFIAESGSSGQAELVEAILNGQGHMKKVAALEMRYLNFVTPLDRFGRNLAAAGGRMYARDKLRSYEHNPTEKNYKVLESLFGRDRPNELTLGLRKAVGGEETIMEIIQRRNWTEAERHMLETLGGQIVHDRSQGRLLPIDMPEAAADPLLRLLYQLQSYNIRMTAETYRQLNWRDPTSMIRSNPQARARFLATMALGFGVSAGILWLKREMRHADPEKWGNSPLYQQLGDIFAFYGVAPAFWDAWSIGTGRYGLPSETLAGPFFRYGFTLGDATVSSIKQGEIGPLGRWLLRAIPIGYWNVLGIPTGGEIAKKKFPVRPVHYGGEVDPE